MFKSSFISEITHATELIRVFFWINNFPYSATKNGIYVCLLFIDPQLSWKPLGQMYSSLGISVLTVKARNIPMKFRLHVFLLKKYNVEGDY